MHSFILNCCLWLLILMCVRAAHVTYQMLPVDLFKSHITIPLKHRIQNQNLKWAVKTLLRNGFIDVILERGTWSVDNLISHFISYSLIYIINAYLDCIISFLSMFALLLLVLSAEGRRSSGGLHPTWGSSIDHFKKTTLANINLVCNIFNHCSFQLEVTSTQNVIIPVSKAQDRWSCLKSV